MEINHKTVLVTGASGGIGAAIAKAMASAGAAEVLLLARNEGALKRVADEIAAKGCNARVYPVDLSDPGQISTVVKRIMEDVGVPDILINNAGSGQWKFLEDTTTEEIRDMMALPYFAAAWLTQAFLPAMRRRGTGHIVNISSTASRVVWPGATAYTAARWAVRGLTEALRADLHGSGIRVTLYESGPVESDYWRHNPGSRERVPKIGKMIRALKPEEVGTAVVNGVRCNARLVVVPFAMKLIYVQISLFPRLVQWLMTSTGYRCPRG
jgi:short-subunit dehydrogenase